MAKKYRHSKDFSFVHWNGTDHSFTKTQADAVSEWWQAIVNGTPDLRDETVLAEIGAKGRNPNLRDIFKDHPAWGTMIVRGIRKGTHRLSPTDIF